VALDERRDRGGGSFLLVCAPWRTDRSCGRGDKLCESAARQSEQSAGVIERGPVAKRRDRQAARSGAGNQHLAEEFSFGLVHADMDGQDFVGGPRGHSSADEDAAPNDLVARCGQARCSSAHAFGRQSMSGGHALAHALARSRRGEPFGCMVGCESTLWQQLKLRALDHLQLTQFAAKGNQDCAARSSLQSESDAHGLSHLTSGG
jgi:hypothetical protein